MTFDAIGPVALITGGGTGIGAAVARLLAATHRVVVCGRRAESIDRVAKEIGGLALVADISIEASCRELVQHVTAEYGRLDGLVLNAGIVKAAPVATMTTADWQAQIDTNLTGPFFLARECIPHLIKSKGSLVSVASVSASEVGAGLSAYAASKAGLTLLTQSIAFEYARHGIRANVIAPGWIRTEMGDMEMMTFGNGNLEDAYARVTRFVPQRRPGLATEAASAVVWLLSPAASYVNGAVLNVDGGTSTVSVGLVDFDEP